jgi:hypothetical protein
VTAGAIPLAGVRGDLRVRRPALFSTEPLDPATALGELFTLDAAASARSSQRGLVANARRRLGALAPALDLLPSRERERAGVLTAWSEAVFATCGEHDLPEERRERLDRSAFLLARALAGETVDPPFAQRFAAESARREFGRRALDALLAEARRRIDRPGCVAEDDESALRLGAAAAEALIGIEPTPATVDASGALLRLARMARVPAAVAVGAFPLLLPEDAASHPHEARVGAIAAECDAIHQLLLRGARSIGEVPLTFRAAIAGAMALALRLLGRIESNPEALLTRPLRLGRLERIWTLWRVRRESGR